MAAILFSIPVVAIIMKIKAEDYDLNNLQLAIKTHNSLAFIYLLMILGGHFWLFYIQEFFAITSAALGQLIWTNDIIM